MAEPRARDRTGRPALAAARALPSRGAVFGTRNGWERPLFFGGSLDYSWDRPSWLAASGAEQRACRTGVAVFDQTSFSKYLVSGPDALAALQWVCAADVDVPVGHVVYTPWLNERGAYEADLTVSRDGPDSFWVVSSSATTVRDLDWLRRQTGVAANDVTDDYAVLGVMGPGRRRCWVGPTFPFATSRTMTVAGREVRATRMTYVGELGWELTVPVEHAREVYDALSAGGAMDAGYNALESLRLEKGYRAFGRELTPDYTPVEAGLMFATALKGDKDFLGRDALEAHRDELAAGGPRRRLVSFVVEDPDGDAVGRRAAASRRRAGRPGHQRGVGGDRRGVSRTRLPARRRTGHQGLAGRRRRSRSTSPARAYVSPGDADSAPGLRPGAPPWMASRSQRDAGWAAPAGFVTADAPVQIT